MRLQHTLYTQLPVWARPTNVIMRYVMRRSQQRRSFVLQWTLRLLGLAVVLALVVISQGFYSADEPLAMARAQHSPAFTVLYFPLLVLQFAVLIWAFLSTSNMVWNERARGTWEAFKITSHGAEAVIRSRWAAAFYQMRWGLGLLMLPRIVFAGMMLADLTDYQGYHLDLYISGITPAVSIEVAVLLLAAFMTAALLQVMVMVGLSASIGLAISAMFSNRGTITVARLIVLTLLVALFMGSFQVGQATLDGSDPFYTAGTLSTTETWGNLLILGTFGDLGLRFMDLRTFLQAWTDVEYGVLLGAVILGVVMLQAVVTNSLLLWAAQRASRPERD